MLFCWGQGNCHPMTWKVREKSGKVLLGTLAVVYHFGDQWLFETGRLLENLGYCNREKQRQCRSTRRSTRMLKRAVVVTTGPLRLYSMFTLTTALMSSSWGHEVTAHFSVPCLGSQLTALCCVRTSSRWRAAVSSRKATRWPCTTFREVRQDCTSVPLTTASVKLSAALSMSLSDVSCHTSLHASSTNTNHNTPFRPFLLHWCRSLPRAEYRIKFLIPLGYSVIEVLWN